jgi:nucleoside 2-deoxyribosyltransferase
MEKLVYLAGGITGLTLEEASAWRERIANKFPKDIIVISPLRGKSYLKTIVGEGTVKDHYDNKLLSTSRGITTRDRNDVTRCDAILVNLLGATKPSIGTIMEIAWADMLRKPIVVVMEPENVHQHAMIKESVGFITDNLDEAVDLVIQLLKTGC